MITNKFITSKRLSAALALGIVGWVSGAQAAATLVIVNGDAAGVGFNDPTVVAPVGGNTGTTLGEQRLNAFQAAANKWGATLTSVPVIRIQARWTALSCTSSGAVLGSAGATEVFADFPGAIKPSTLYSAALTNKLFGATADPTTPEIAANFNVNLGQPGCLTGTFFYLGLDNNHGANIDLVTVLTHEFGHGLGFQTFTSGSTGAQIAGFPSIWDHFMQDNTTGKLWVNMTNAERVTSALNFRMLAWTGSNVTTSVPLVLSPGTPSLAISGPAAGAATGNYNIGTASFGAPLSTTAVAEQLMPVVDLPNGTGLACNPLSALNALAVKGHVALVDRGTCTFAAKAKNVQDAGAIGIVIANNAVGPAPGLGGSDPTVTIPAISVSQADGVTLKTALARRSRTASGVIASLSVNSSQYAGADLQGRALLYTPNPFQGGSSVSHWDTIAFPNQLMEPAINGDLTHEVTPPQDLTFKLLQDIGW